jgi:hypothetical protein
MFVPSELPSASLARRDILFPPLSAGGNPAERGLFRLFVRTTRGGRQAYFGPFSVSLSHFLRGNRTTAILVRMLKAQVVSRIFCKMDHGCGGGPLWATRSVVHRAIGPYEPSRRHAQGLLLVLAQVVHVQVAMRLEPVLVHLDREGADQP